MSKQVNTKQIDQDFDAFSKSYKSIFESIDQIIHSPIQHGPIHLDEFYQTNGLDPQLVLNSEQYKQFTGNEVPQRKRTSGFAQIKAICLDCGSNLENQLTTQCINGHDNWITKNSNWKKQQRAEFQFEMPWTEIVQKMQKKESLNRKR